MKCEVTQVNGDGSIRRALVDTANRHDAARWESLAEQAHLDVPPPYRPHPGEPVYEIVVDGRGRGRQQHLSQQPDPTQAVRPSGLDQVRVDVLRPNSPLESLSPNDILATLYAKCPEARICGLGDAGAD